ncbi:MAG: AtpZ/AtpI family protein [Candidatus Eremiobacteraeota bacterium]|nr:AtpZ/AtpI family protein [Candidatus Eremiobacteraeota bacterium]
MEIEEPEKLAEKIKKARGDRKLAGSGDFLRAFTMAWSLGFTMIIPILAGWWVGNHFDKLCGTTYMMPLCMVAGIILGGIGTYRLLRPFLKE